jgi:hypothetical protein
MVRVYSSRSAWRPAAGTNAPTGPGLISESGTGYQRQSVACDTVPSESAATARFVRFKLVWH